jgi:hypothetical protein
MRTSPLRIHALTLSLSLLPVAGFGVNGLSVVDGFRLGVWGEQLKNTLCFRNQQLNSPSPFAPENSMKTSPLRISAVTLGISLLPMIGLGAQSVTTAPRVAAPLGL